MTEPKHERRAQPGDNDAGYGGAQRAGSAVTDNGERRQRNGG